MTAADRLRTLAGEWDVYGLGGALEDVARQIERERACDADTTENVRLIVGGVIDSMERHVSGVEGAEDSPVARWARELREALKSDASDGSDGEKPSCPGCHDAADATFGGRKVTRDPAEDVSMSAYDLLSSDERNAIAWVRDHGGIDYVKREWRSRVPYDRYVRRRQSLLGHIAECETALGRRREIISKLTHRVSDLTNENAELRKRLMPEGMEWPRFEDGEPVRIGDEFMGNDGKIYTVKQVRFMGCYFSLYDFCDEKPQLKADYGECVKRPAPKALDADGAEIRVGDTVWDVEYGCEHVVTKVSKGTVFVAFEDESADRYDPASLTHRAPVLAADGRPLRVGETVWDVNDGREYKVVTVESPVQFDMTLIKVDDGKAAYCVWIRPDNLTHQRPVLDADGVPIKVGDTVYEVGENYPPFIVGRLPEPGAYRTVKVVHPSGAFTFLDPERLTHTKPEVDSWQRIEEDVMADAKDYCESRGISSEYPKHSGKAKCEDLVRRCRALAERERGE